MSSYKREYNSERRRKRRNLTPKNLGVKIRENITPRGDGNLTDTEIKYLPLINKREYNSERRRKLKDKIRSYTPLMQIRENITPRGDGN